MSVDRKDEASLRRRQDRARSRMDREATVASVGKADATLATLLKREQVLNEIVNTLSPLKMRREYLRELKDLQAAIKALR